MIKMDMRKNSELKHEEITRVFVTRDIKMCIYLYKLYPKAKKKRKKGKGKGKKRTKPQS